MSLTAPLNPKIYGLGELLAYGRVYKVPRFQRDYSWNEENWSELWEDILKLRSEVTERHYMGAVVIRQTADREYEIIDGQQRFTTISVLILAIIKRLEDLANEGVDPEENRERASLFRRQYVRFKDPVALTERSKLTLNRHNDDFYQDFVMRLRKPEGLLCDSESNQSLWRALEYFDARLAQDPEIGRNGQLIATLLNDAISLRLIFIGIEVEDEIKAFTLFETLNARGVRLGSADLIKNFLFSSFGAKGDIDEAEYAWELIVEAVGYERIPDLIRYYFCRFHKHIRDEALLRLTKSKAKTPAEALEFLRVLGIEAETLNTLLDDRHPTWNGDLRTRFQIRVLNLLGVKQLFPILLVAKRTFGEDDFKRLLALLIACAFRHTLIGKKASNDLEAAYNGAAMGIEAGQLKRPRAVFQVIRETYLEDRHFERAFAITSLEFTARKKVLRYVLFELEREMGGRKDDFEFNTTTLEYVFPRNPSEAWNGVFDKHHDSYLERLANYTLLESELNREIGNDGFDAKRPVYRLSGYKMTAALADQEEWTPDQIDRRQAAWAKLACRIWRSEFADPA